MNSMVDDRVWVDFALDRQGRPLKEKQLLPGTVVRFGMGPFFLSRGMLGALLGTTFREVPAPAGAEVFSSAVDRQPPAAPPPTPVGRVLADPASPPVQPGFLGVTPVHDPAGR